MLKIHSPLFQGLNKYFTLKNIANLILIPIKLNKIFFALKIFYFVFDRQ